MKIIPPFVRRGMIRFARDVLARRAVRRAPALSANPFPVSLHMVVAKETLLMGLLALRSFEFHTGCRWAPTIHDDGSLDDTGVRSVRENFPDARVIRRAEADAELAAALEDFPACRANRLKHNWFLKVFDTRHFAVHDRYIVMDSDIVFFRRPGFVLDWAGARDDGFWFMEDTNEKYASPRPDLEAAMGFPIWPRVNSGLDLMIRPRVPLALCETFLARCAGSAKHFQFLEQSLFAVIGSADGRGGTLPKTYEISWGNFRARDAICRHYVADFKHDLLYVEGATAFFFQSRAARPSDHATHS